jgi:hypothetical protein
MGYEDFFGMTNQGLSISKRIMLAFENFAAAGACIPVRKRVSFQRPQMPLDVLNLVININEEKRHLLEDEHTNPYLSLAQCDWHSKYAAGCQKLRP